MEHLPQAIPEWGSSVRVGDQHLGKKRVLFVCHLGKIVMTAE
jgi:hypothetical protein